MSRRHWLAGLRLRLLTYNVWFGSRRFNERATHILALIQRYAPHVVMLQEARLEKSPCPCVLATRKPPLLVLSQCSHVRSRQDLCRVLTIQHTWVLRAVLAFAPCRSRRSS